MSDLINGSNLVQVVDTPLAAPGTCVVCGIAGPQDDRQFIDFGFQLDWYGAVVFCTFCIIPLAKAAGFVSQAELEAIKVLATGFNEDLEDTKHENKVLKNALGTLLRSSSTSVDDYIASVPVSQTEPEPIPAQSEPVQPEPEPTEPESKPDEPSSIKNARNVSPANRSKSKREPSFFDKSANG